MRVTLRLLNSVKFPVHPERSRVAAVSIRNLCRINEDRWVCEQIPENDSLLCAVFDGHGGEQASIYAAENFAQNLRSALRAGQSRDIPAALREAYRVTDEGFSAIATKEDKPLVGTTATTAVITDTSLVLANVGDSPAILYTANGEAKQLSKDHKPSEEDELKRIKAAGGDVFARYGIPRLQGRLAVSRAIGDVALKPYGLIAEPSIAQYNLSVEAGFLLLCSDGLFDGLEREQVFKIVKASGSQEEAARRLVAASELGPGSRDSITTMIVPLAGWDLMRAKAEESAIYQHLLSLGPTDPRLRQERLFRFMFLLEAYLPSATTPDQLQEMLDAFTQRGEGDFARLAFKVFDTDCDGLLGEDEIESLFKTIGTTVDVAPLFKLADTNSDGVISYDEFVRALQIYFRYAKDQEVPNSPCAGTR